MRRSLLFFFVLVVLAAACAAPEDERPPPVLPPAALVGVPGPTPAPLPKAAFEPDAPRPMPTESRTIAAEPKAPEARRRRGAPIDLDVKDADVRDVFRLLAEVGHVNIVVGDDVHGSVTLRMKNVPWDQVLDAVVRVKGLFASWEDNVITITGSRR